MANDKGNVARTLAAAPLIPPAQQAQTDTTQQALADTTTQATPAKWTPPTMHGFEPASGKEFSPKEGGGTAAKCAVARCRLAGLNFKVAVFRHAKANGKVDYYGKLPRYGMGVQGGDVFTPDPTIEADVQAWLIDLGRQCYHWRKASADHIAPPIADRGVRAFEADE